MTRYRFLLGGVLLITTLGSADAGAQSAPSPVVDAAVQVTTSPSPVRAHSGPALAVHPNHRNVVVLAEAEARSGRCGLHVSTNGGLSWNETASPQPAEMPSCIWGNYGRVADISFAKSGTLHYGLTGLKSAGNPPSLVFDAQSSNLGKTFDIAKPPGLEPRLSENNFGSHGEPTVRADPNRPDRVYMAWQTNWGLWNKNPEQLPPPGKPDSNPTRSRPLLAVSDDGGKTFAEPVKFAGDVGEHLNEPYIIVGNDGEVFVFIGEHRGDETPVEGKVTPGARLWLATSRDGGKTFQQKAIHTLPDDRVEGFSWLGAARPAIDRRTGDLYVVWEDIGGAATSAQFMRSGDGGNTWSKPVQINDVAHGRHNYYNELYPTIDVAPDGRVDVAWYDWRHDPGYTPKEGKFQDIYYRYSKDGGRTWSASTKINDRAIDRQFGVFSKQGVNGPVGMASLDDVVYIAWDDTRNGTSENEASDVYFTRVRFGSAQSVVSGGERDGPSWIWILPGVALGLTGAGLLLLIGGRFSRARDVPSGMAGDSS